MGPSACQRYGPRYSRCYRREKEGGSFRVPCRLHTHSTIFLHDLCFYTRKTLQELTEERGCYGGVGLRGRRVDLVQCPSESTL